MRINCWKYGIVGYLLMIGWAIPSMGQELQVTGVYQGKSIFVQNPLFVERSESCVTRITVNNVPLRLDYKSSALEVNFSDKELYVPVTVVVKHQPDCTPKILNEDAIRFHSAFSFTQLLLNDTALYWKTKGERMNSKFTVEKLFFDGWEYDQELPSEGKFEGAEYSVFPDLKEGVNKFRIKYEVPIAGRYLFSEELEHVYYPEPIRIFPLTVTRTLNINRVADYEISTPEGYTILTGRGKVIELERLRRGEYFITVENTIEKFTKN
ncbi:MAG: hypothetical protein RIC80_08465 [Cyclobacteriaceae bacterium]